MEYTVFDRGAAVGSASAERRGLYWHIAAECRMETDRIVRLYGESERSPEQRLQDKDKKRRVNYKHYTGRDWGVSQNYHLSLDSADIGVDHCADVILYAMGLDPAKLPMPEGEKEHN